MGGTAILAIDQGTTNTKALLVDFAGSIIGRASRSMQVTYPRPGWAEQSAEGIWETVQDVIAELVKAHPNARIEGLAISNQRESVIVWDAETGKPIGPCVIWQCRRSSDLCASLRAQGHEAEILERTGLGIDPLFSAGKIAWLLDYVSGSMKRALNGELRAGTVESWLIWNLTGGRHTTDHSNASRTQLFNLNTLTWDERLADLFGVPLRLLPQIVPSDSLFGTTKHGAAALQGGIPIHAALGDSHAALFGHGIRAPGQVKVSCGTGSSMMMVAPHRILSRHSLSSTIAWSRKGTVLHALEGNITVSGHAAAFVTHLLGVANEEELCRLAQTVNASDGVSFVPGMAGLGAPHWNDKARGLISGMSLGTLPAHIARATFEAMALQICDVFWAMEADLGESLPSISVDGGASRNDFLLQLLADLLDRPVIRGSVADVSALGAAQMAAEAIGIWTGVERPLGDTTTFVPSMPASGRKNILSKWREALARATFQVE